MADPGIGSGGGGGTGEGVAGVGRIRGRSRPVRPARGSGASPQKPTLFALKPPKKHIVYFFATLYR